MVRDGLLSSPECQPFWAERTPQLARVSALLGEADSARVTILVIMASPECHPFWEERTSHLTRVSSLLGGADSSARLSVNLSATSELFSSRVVLERGADSLREWTQLARVSAFLGEADSTRMTILVIMTRGRLFSSPECHPFCTRRTSQLARFSALLCGADSSARAPS
ncbi:hypothetical protein ACLB2K_059367 [Fragaria x ananassa]